MLLWEGEDRSMSLKKIYIMNGGFIVRRKKLLSMLLATALVITSFAGCSAKEEKTNVQGNVATQPPKVNENAGVTNTPKERQKVSIMSFDYSGQAMMGPNAEQVIKVLEDYTQTDVEFQFVPSDAYEDKLSLTLASGSDMPMIIACGSFNANIVNNARAGAFWDLNDFIFDEAKYPNLSKANKNICNMVSVDGGLYGIYRARTLGRNGFGYRKDWADKLGLKEPETIDDVYNMLYQFTHGDPDGNGKKDTDGLNLCKYTGPLDIMQTWFGVGNGWVEQNGSLVPVHRTPEYEEALDWFKKLYDDGLIAKDWAVRETGTWMDDNKNGLSGMYIDTIDNARKVWDYYVNNNIPSVLNDGTIASFPMGGGIAKTAGGQKHTLATAGFNGFFVLTKGGCKTEADVEAALHFLDKMNDDEMQILSSYGLKDIHYSLDENNVFTDIKGDNKDTLLLDYEALNQTVAYIPTNMITGIKIPTTERQDIQAELYIENEKNVVFNPAAALIINSETYTLNGANLDQILNDARTQYIVGEIDKDGLKAAWNLWASTGGNDVIKEVNDAYAKTK